MTETININRNGVVIRNAVGLTNREGLVPSFALLRWYAVQFRYHRPLYFMALRPERGVSPFRRATIPQP
jgi:hypothetical protein